MTPTELARLRLAIAARRRDADRQRRREHDQAAHLAALQRELALLGPESEQHPGLGDEVARAEDDLNTMRLELLIAEEAYAAAPGAYDEAVAAEPAIWADDRPVPLLLTPVRLEAVHSQVAGSAQLLLRVYPDDVHVDAHEEGLTAVEREAGQRYWTAVAAPEADDALRAAAWAELVARLGSARAAWALEALRPGAPEPAARSGTWTRAARTMLLPDRFVFSAYNEGEDGLRLAWREEGADIPDDLKLGFAPPQEGVTRTDGLPWDPDSRWLVDFGRAVENGMGLAVPLPENDEPYDLLTAVGVMAGLDPETAAARWQAALLAHRFGDGLAFLPTRTPTNNTLATRSGWRSHPEPRPPEEIDRQREQYDPAGPQAAARAARAFGVDGAEVLAAVQDALGDDDGPDLTRLHHAFGLYFALSLLLRPYPPSTEARDDMVVPPDVTDLVAHFTDHVRSRGTLPTLRVGRQPYGVLPASSFDLWRGDVTDPRLTGHLLSVTSTLEDSFPSAVQVGAGEDQDAVILDLLSRTPAAERMVDTMTRPVELGQAQVDEPPPSVVGSVPPGSRAEQFHLPDESGKPPRPVLGDPSENVKAVLAARPLAELLRLADERQAALDASADADQTALDARRTELQDALAPFIESPDPDTFHSISWRVFENLVLLIQQNRRMRDDQAATPEEQAFLPVALERTRELAAALVELEPRAETDLPGLDRLMFEVFDTVGHRVDAWITSYADSRLRRIRESEPTGLRLGVYGWLTDVRDPGTGPESDGYILAPSLQHAATAAVLRAGFRAHSDKAAFAVDLQSWRVRAAREMIDGIRTGQPLWALLGYRFERGLHEAQLDQLIDDFRLAYPPSLAVVPGTGTPGAATSVEARNVVDGQRLRMAQPAEGQEGLLDQLPPEQRQVVDRLIAELDEMVDAGGDLLVGESVFHLVGGNPLRAGLSADAIGRGDRLPGEFDLVRTPRGATTVAHHVGVLCPSGGGVTGWNDDRALAVLEPAVEGWCRARLGPAGDWRFGGGGRMGEGVGLDALGWCALDVVGAARAAPGGSPLMDALRQAGVELDEPSVERARELGLLCERLRALLASATPLLTGHFDLTAEPYALADLDGLGARAGTWLAAVAAARQTLATALAPERPDPAAVGSALAPLAALGVAAALPDPGADPVGQGGKVLAMIDPDTVQPPPPPPSRPADADAWVRDTTSRVRVLAGDHMQVVPVLNTAPPGPDRVPAGAGPDEIGDWLRGIARIRPTVATLEETLVAGIVLAERPEGDVTATQTPFAPGARWVATAPAVQGDRPPVRATLVLHHDGPPEGEECAGLVMDTWNQAVPRPSGANGPEEIAALAFHHDRPGARAPQALLLAVPPDLDRPWRMEDVHGVVEDTLRLAVMRTLDLIDVPALRGLLPVPGAE
ncbi:hypothetical protein [Spongiactinospora sp. TRM90649]|uniref:hypothetical protein n=1 Tax=Spongiactinospora sp. TRM90649 TaxID=3031114 RepID=UPI0023F8CD02|nr:hypothetical protein [Spongiactinospora sp. TRM90649]MDF5753243.1 hypothetical protein [Spongiactinospora sp. TRM90649]